MDIYEILQNHNARAFEAAKRCAITDQAAWDAFMTSHRQWSLLLEQPHDRANWWQYWDRDETTHAPSGCDLSELSRILNAHARRAMGLRGEYPDGSYPAYRRATPADTAAAAAALMHQTRLVGWSHN